MKSLARSGISRKSNDSMRLVLITFVRVVFGFWVGVSFPTLSLTTMNLPLSLLPTIDLSNIEDKRGHSTQTLLNVWYSVQGKRRSSVQAQHLDNTSKIWIPSNPRGAERLPPKIVEAESDLFLHRLWGKPSEDLIFKPKYLVTFTVGYKQKENVDAAVKKFSENFTILLFHYDGCTTEWDEFEWSKRAIHVSARKQTKCGSCILTSWQNMTTYLFGTEDLGVEHFDAEEYLKLVRKHRLEISQPVLEPKKGLTWQMTKRRVDREVHKSTEEKSGWCGDQRLPPCTAFVEIMALVFSRGAWLCVWHLIQNDLVHGWGLDFALRKCVEPGHEKIGVVDVKWVVHQTVPSLGNQGQAENGKAPWQGVRERCKMEWTMFQSRVAKAEDAYFKTLGFNRPNSTARQRTATTKSDHILPSLVSVT